jgi:hypothetical protein
MEEFLEYIKTNELEPLPEYYTGPDRMGYRFLQGNKWMNDKTAIAIQEHYKWIQSVYPNDGTKSIPFLELGSVYIQGRCKVGHQPIIVLNIKKFLE